MNLTKEDYEIFESIEKIREEIKKKYIPIKVIDYGAGNPENERSAHTMYKGVEKITNTFEQCSIGLKEKWAEIIYSLVKENMPKKVLELGTCCGFSSIYMAKGCSSSLIYTIEGDKNVAKIASKNIKAASCSNIKQFVGRFQDILDDVLNEIKEIDMAFIDGHHDKKATLNYFEKIKPFLSEKSIVIFDDISWSKGMIEAWEIIKNDSMVKEYKDLKKLGICYFY
ncbi:methyltransferase [Halarcobacter ebronensis]|uniref:Methyltransferase n=1 Tax=Halarcobacter ebronensis TaxID=1462615 RepID=A0A4Q1AP03_9BACT|nr:methyltransferase [Halarcobacter ebronensis]